MQSLYAASRKTTEPNVVVHMYKCNRMFDNLESASSRYVGVVFNKPGHQARRKRLTSAGICLSDIRKEQQSTGSLPSISSPTESKHAGCRFSTSLFKLRMNSYMNLFNVEKLYK